MLRGASHGELGAARAVPAREGSTRGRASPVQKHLRPFLASNTPRLLFVRGKPWRPPPSQDFCPPAAPPVVAVICRLTRGSTPDLKKQRNLVWQEKQVFRELCVDPGGSKSAVSLVFLTHFTSVLSRRSLQIQEFKSCKRVCAWAKLLMPPSQPGPETCSRLSAGVSRARVRLRLTPVISSKLLQLCPDAPYSRTGSRLLGFNKRSASFLYFLFLATSRKHSRKTN